MELVKFLNILGAFLGFISAGFFAMGSASLKAEDILLTVLPRRTFNNHWARALSNQRAEYIAGSALLVLAFSAQIASSLVPTHAAVPFCNSAICAWSCLVILALILAAVAFMYRHRAAISYSNRVREMWQSSMAAIEAVETTNLSES